MQVFYDIKEQIAEGHSTSLPHATLHILLAVGQAENLSTALFQLGRQPPDSE